jgi:hypothetical protein
MSGLEEGVRSLLAEFNLTGCVVRARTTGYRLGESQYGIVDEVGFLITKKAYANILSKFNLSRK